MKIVGSPNRAALQTKTQRLDSGFMGDLKTGCIPLSGGYVLKFISGKYQGGEFPLEMETEIVIGRSSDLDMVLVEDMVSRKHARITSFSGNLEIEDFGSTNGTFVNGERITKARLKEGDRILVGTNIIKLVHRDSMDSDTGSGPSYQPGPSGPARPTMPPRPGHGQTHQTMIGSITGLIDEVPLPDLLQLFSTSKKSGVLVIMNPNEDIGKVFLRTGRVYFTSINDEKDISPYKAFYRLMSWRSGTFSLEQPSDETFENEMNESIEGLMMEGMRILDEIHNLGPDVPDSSALLAIQTPLLSPLRELSAEQLDVFQLVYNYSKYSTVLNRSEHTDLDTTRHLLHLIRKEYVRVA